MVNRLTWEKSQINFPCHILAKINASYVFPILWALFVQNFRIVGCVVLLQGEIVATAFNFSCNFSTNILTFFLYWNIFGKNNIFRPVVHNTCLELKPFFGFKNSSQVEQFTKTQRNVQDILPLWYFVNSCKNLTKA